MLFCFILGECSSRRVVKPVEELTVKDITLGDGLRKLDGLRMDFDKKLRGREGEKWLEGYAKFLRGENPWAEETHGGVRFDLDTSKWTCPQRLR
ncbi:MAG: hypothetical protein HYT29_01995 [Parcubacteria group bacterium]|nr:hypothetical protein [Parcubacteria group bacterium]